MGSSKQIMNEIREITDKHIFYAIKSSQLITIITKQDRFIFKSYRKLGLNNYNYYFL